MVFFLASCPLKMLALRTRMKQVDLDLHFHLCDKNSEIYREFFEFEPEIAEFCPKYAGLVLGTGNEQGISSPDPHE
jgi:hypothetical protein